jgi:hypothetical protein
MRARLIPGRRINDIGREAGDDCKESRHENRAAVLAQSLATAGADQSLCSSLRFAALMKRVALAVTARYASA